AQDERSGNAYWDALYQAIDQLRMPPALARQVVVVLTDITAGDGSGTQGEQSVISLATERGVEIYGLYFLYEEGGIPEGTPRLPRELTIPTAATGGTAYNSAGQTRSAEDYTDDAVLPTLMGTLVLRIGQAYKLTINSP